MSTGKVKAVLFIIIGLLVIALVCSWLAGKDSTDKGSISNTGYTGSETVIAETPTPGENAPTTSDGTNSGSNAALNGTASVGGYTNTGSNANANTNTGSNANATTNVGSNAGVDTGKDSTNPNPTPTPTPVPEVTPEPETETTANVALDPDPNYTRRKLGTAQTFSSNNIGGLCLKAEVSCETISSTQVEVTISLYVDSYSIYLNENVGGAGVSLGDVFSSVTTQAVRKDSNDYSTSFIGSKSFVVEISDGNTLTLPVAVEWYYNGSYNGNKIDTLECGGSYTIKRA